MIRDAVLVLPSIVLLTAVIIIAAVTRHKKTASTSGRVRWRGSIAQQLSRMEQEILAMSKSIESMLALAATMRAQITHNTSVINSVVAVCHTYADQIESLKRQLADAGVNQERLAELSDALDALAATTREQAAATAVAVAANTSVAPVPSVSTAIDEPPPVPPVESVNPPPAAADQQPAS